jgi:hypothetical protein
MSLKSHLASSFALLLMLALASCGHGFNGSNCESPIAATETEQCNPYLSRTP